tara:strand:+ start:52 stop:372 length:321 start_codon:yes stop_codon:yes gene_type:complete
MSKVKKCENYSCHRISGAGKVRAMRNIITKETPYRVGPLRTAGLEAKWSKSSSGEPYIVVRNPSAKSEHQRTFWWAVDVPMWNRMKKHGIIDGFNSATLLGDVFHI